MTDREKAIARAEARLDAIIEAGSGSPWEQVHETGELQARRILMAMGFVRRESYRTGGLHHASPSWRLDAPGGLVAVVVAEKSRRVFVQCAPVVSWSSAGQLARSAEWAESIVCTLDVRGIAR